MATLSSQSTIEEVEAAYDDNADYDLEGSVEKAKAFIQAARILLRRLTEEVERGGDRVKDRYEKIEQRLKDAEKWWRANDTNAASAVPTGGARYLERGDCFRP